MFVPSAGSVLVDWGAEVIKVENPAGGDPQRGLITSGLIPGGGVNFMVEQPNRGKRSVALNISHPDGREALMKLVETGDVFLTNYLEPVRRRLGIDNEAILARNPTIIIARGTGQGPAGPDADKGGFDGASFWARGGVAAVFPPDEAGWPQGQPSPAFGDVMGGMALAGAIAARAAQAGAHRRTERDRRVAAGHRPVADLAAGGGIQAVRAYFAAPGRPATVAQPRRGGVPHCRRPLHQPHPVAERPVLAGTSGRSSGAADPGDRRAVQHLRGPDSQPGRVHRHPRRGIRSAHPGRVEGAPRRLRGGVDSRSRPWPSSTTTPR